jgi:RecT family
VAQPEQSQEMTVRRTHTPAPLHNGIVSPDRWTMFGRIATTIAKTDFVPAALRGRPEAVMAALLYGDSLGLHPSVALTDIYIVDGKVGVSGALMLAKIREHGHKVKFVWVTDEAGERIGATAYGQRVEDGEVVDEDEWTYTLADATKAGLYPNSSPKAAWSKSPMVMCRWRALAQLARFLFPDLFRGGSVYVPDEVEEAAYADRIRHNGAEGGRDSGEAGEIDYGDDEMLAAWLVALFAAANNAEPGIWLPAKQRIALRGKTQEQREALAGTVREWLDERGLDVPSRPTPDEETVGDEEFEVVDDPRVDGSSVATGTDGTALD